MSFLDRLKDDIVYLRGAYRALKMTTPIAKHPTRVFPVVIEELADRYGDAPALISDRERFSYRALAERARTATRAGRCSEKLGKGETVCLLMPNRPEYMAAWIGITSMGGVVALINTNLVGPSLAHCIDIVDAEAHHRRGGARRHVCHRAAAAQDRAEAVVARRQRRVCRASIVAIDALSGEPPRAPPSARR